MTVSDWGPPKTGWGFWRAVAQTHWDLLARVTVVRAVSEEPPKKSLAQNRLELGRCGQAAGALTSPLLLSVG